MDIDHFKKINDTFGHQAGDNFLVEIAHLISSHIRGYDFACRYGGEEFLLVMPGTTRKVASRRAEVIRKKIESIRIPRGKKLLKVTVSIGVATYPISGKAAEEIVIKADKALYRSKRSGRNRVTVWDKTMG
jgi:diguanylate cyclase (GGDEF)-like protein